MSVALAGSGLGSAISAALESMAVFVTWTGSGAAWGALGHEPSAAGAISGALGLGHEQSATGWHPARQTKESAMRGRSFFMWLLVGKGFVVVKENAFACGQDYKGKKFFR